MLDVKVLEPSLSSCYQGLPAGYGNRLLLRCWAPFLLWIPVTDSLLRLRNVLHKRATLMALVVVVTAVVTCGGCRGRSNIVQSVEVLAMNQWKRLRQQRLRGNRMQPQHSEK